MKTPSRRAAVAALSAFRQTRVRAACFLAALVLGAAGDVSAQAQPGGAGFVPLIDRPDMSGFDLVGGAEGTWVVEQDTIKCTGRPNGYFATKRAFKNFILRFEFRYVRPPDLADDASFPGNSGCLLFITGEPKVWPKCVEVQGRNRDVGRIIAIGGAPAVKAVDDPAMRKAALRPVGEWNRLEIEAQDGAVVATLNDVIVCRSEAGELREGPIGFQSEGAEIHFRGLSIRELP